MEIEKFMFTSPKTCFNSVTGRKIADNLLGLVLLDNQWSFCFFRDESFALIDEKGKVVVKNQNIGGASGKFYSIYHDDHRQSIYSVDGTLLVDNADDVNFLMKGWFIAAKDGVNTLYNPDGEPVISGEGRIFVLEDGSRFLVEDKSGSISLYNKKRECVTRNIHHFCFLSVNFFSLSFDDKTVVYDLDAHTETVVKTPLVKLLLGKKFMAVEDGQTSLYKADGSLLLTGFVDYVCFNNGLFIAKDENGYNSLFDEKSQEIVSGIVDVKFDSASDWLVVSTLEKDFLFDETGKLLYKTYAQAISLCGKDTFLVTDTVSGLGCLYAKDLSILAPEVFEAKFFDNGWCLLTLPPLSPGKKCYVKLLDNQGTFVAASEFGLEYIENYKAFIQHHENGKFSLTFAGYEQSISNADAILVLGEFYMVRRHDTVEIFSFKSFNPYPSKISSALNVVDHPLWFGDTKELMAQVAFCGGQCMGNICDFIDIAEDNNDPSLN